MKLFSIALFLMAICTVQCMELPELIVGEVTILSTRRHFLNAHDARILTIALLMSITQQTPMLRIRVQSKESNDWSIGHPALGRFPLLLPAELFIRCPLRYKTIGEIVTFWFDDKQIALRINAINRDTEAI